MHEAHEERQEELVLPENMQMDLNQATRYARSLATTREEIAAKKAVAEKEIAYWQEKIDELNGWLEGELENLNAKEAFLEMSLTLYHIEQYTNASEKKKEDLKSIKLPYGITLSSRQPAAQLVVKDKAALLEYAKEAEMVSTPEPVAKWAEIKKGLSVNKAGQVVDLNGEVLEFIESVQEARKFEVK